MPAIRTGAIALGMALLAAVCRLGAAQPNVTTRFGTAVGKLCADVNNASAWSFRGIPYALPPMVSSPWVPGHAADGPESGALSDCPRTLAVIRRRRETLHARTDPVRLTEPAQRIRRSSTCPRF